MRGYNYLLHATSEVTISFVHNNYQSGVNNYYFNINTINNINLYKVKKLLLMYVGSLYQHNDS